MGGMGDQQARIALRERTYGPDDLGSWPIFGGGFINFGYWRDIPLDGELTLDQRIASQQALYDVVLDALALSPGDRVVEVGCGRGLGAAAMLRRGPALVRGVDLVPDQVARANAAHDDERLAFVQGSAYDLPFPDASFERLLSVEAAQHFEDIPGFTREAHRVLAPGGTLAVTTFFAPHEAAAPELVALLDSFTSGLDLPHVVGSVVADLRAAGFADVTTTSIGEHVWHGFDRWIALTEPQGWGPKWRTAVARGLVDYYLVTARKSVEGGSEL
jgi:cyclopropane fatty-acyl-phospholipid synthase-like methyltransferase